VMQSVFDLLKSDVQSAELSRNIRSMAKPDATTAIADVIEKVK